MSFQGVVNGSNPVLGQPKRKSISEFFGHLTFAQILLVGWELAVLDVNHSRWQASHSQPLMGEVAVGITRLSKRGIVFQYSWKTKVGTW